MDISFHRDDLSSLTLLSPAGIVDKSISSLYHELMEGKNIFQVEDIKILIHFK